MNFTEQYQQARKYMSQEMFLEAAMLLKEVLVSDPSNLFASINLASCYYCLNDYKQFKNITTECFEKFERYRIALPNDALVSCSLGLGKLLEELGELSDALKIYEMALLNMQQTDTFRKVYAQKLRVLSMFRSLPLIHEAYLICEQFNETDGQAEIDLQHALLLADFSLFGKDTARRRMTRIFDRLNLKATDKRLIFFDYLFEVLCKENLDEIDKYLMSQFNFSECDHFERMIVGIGKNDWEPTLDYTDQLSPLCAIRFLFLMQIRNGPQASAARKKLLLLLQNIKTQSKNLIVKNWQIKGTSLEIVVDEHCKLLQLGEQNSEVRVTDNTLQLIKMFALASSPDLDTISKAMFDMEYDSTVYDRLRMFVKRFNEKIAPALGIPQVFTLSKNALEKNPMISFLLKT